MALSLPDLFSLTDLKWQHQVGILIGGAAFIWTVRRLYSGLRKSSRKQHLRNKVVCITGAAGGLGSALAQVLWERGARTILTGRNMDTLGSLAGQASWVLNSFTPVLVKLDLTDLDSIPAKSQEILQAFGHVDVLIHNAGVSSRGKALDTAFSVDFDVLKTNYLAPVALTKELLPQMIEHGGGCVVAVSSVQGRFAIPYRSAYSASKHALQAFFDSLRAEMVDSNVDVLVVSPGYIKTGLSLKALRGQGVAHGKMDETTANGMDPKDVAERIVRAIEQREKEVLICGLASKVATVLRAICPTLYFYVMSRRARKSAHLESA